MNDFNDNDPQPRRGWLVGCALAIMAVMALLTGVGILLLTGVIDPQPANPTAVAAEVTAAVTAESTRDITAVPTLFPTDTLTPTITPSLTATLTLTPSDTPTVTPSDTPPPTETPTVTATYTTDPCRITPIDTDVQIRSEPRSDARDIGDLAAGSSIPAINRDGDWYLIDDNGALGWVAAWVVAGDGPACDALPPVTPTPIRASGNVADEDG